MLAEFMGIEWLYWWQLPLFVFLVLPVLVFGGGSLLYVGGRFCARAPKATYWRSVGTNLLASLAGFLLWAILPALGRAAAGPLGAMLGGVLGGVGALLVTWLIIMGMFGTTFGKAILAWLPTLGTGVLMVPLLAATLVPTLQQANELTNRTVCMSNLHSIGLAMTLYRGANDNRPPADFQALIADGQPPKLFVCPSVDPAARPAGQQWDYFHLPPKDDNANRIILCEFRANHGGRVRNVLYNDGHVAKMTEAQFQAELARPENADFAAALRKVEGP
jgi:prepilin-type processing-associated H-X9-DG protein